MTIARTLRAPRALVALLAATLLALLGGLWTAAPATAHDELISSNPGDGEVLDEQPQWLELNFSGNIQEIGTEITVERDGTDYSAGSYTVEGTTLTSALPDDLEPGEYTVNWRVVSEDGHPVSGSFAFTIAGGEDAAPEDEAEADGADETAGLGGGVVDGGGQDVQDDRGALGSGGGDGWSPITIVILSLGVLAAVAAVVVLLTRKRQFGQAGQDGQPGPDGQPGQGDADGPQKP